MPFPVLRTAAAVSNMRGVIIFEDEHLLVANKPAGLNTHAPSPFAGEGLYEWLKNGGRAAGLARHYSPA